MKTENFDDAIRRKIESINPSYDETEIDKTLDYVSANRTKSFARSYGVVMLASLFGLTTIGLLTWNLSQQKEQKQLLETISTLKNNLAHAEKPVAPISDTVYITKYISGANPVQPSKIHRTKQTNVESKNSLLASKGYIPKNNKRDVTSSTQDKSAINNQSQGNQVVNRRTRTPKDAFAVANSNASKNNGSVQSPSEAVIESKKSTDSGSDLSNKENTSEPSKLTDVKTNSGNEGTKSNDFIPTETIQPSLTDISESGKSNAKTDNAVALNAQQNDASNTLQGDTNKHQKPFAFLKKWYYQAGLGYATGDGLTAYGVSGEAYVNRKWSISVGLHLTKVNNEDYDDDNAFHSKKGKNFNQVYSADVPDTSSFSRIEIHTSLIQIPVMLKYHLALNNYFSLLVGVGTDVDLYAKQHVGYHHHDNNSIETLKNFNAIPATELFNNAELTAGIQGQWKHFVLQVTPFISQQIVSVPYKKDDLCFGLGSQLLYAF